MYMVAAQRYGNYPNLKIKGLPIFGKPLTD